MSRLVSLTALLVAMAAIPASAADWGDGGDWDVEYGDFRGGYFNEPKDWSGLGDEDDAWLRVWGPLLVLVGAQSVTGGGNLDRRDRQQPYRRSVHAHRRLFEQRHAKAIAGYSFRTDAATRPRPAALPGRYDRLSRRGHRLEPVGRRQRPASASWPAISTGATADTGRFNYTTATSASTSATTR